MIKKLLCVLLSAILILSCCACSKEEAVPPQQTTIPAATTGVVDFEKYVIAKEVYEALPEPTKLCTYNDITYSLLSYEGKQCVITEMARGNIQVVYEFTGTYEILEEANKRTNGSYLYFINNPTDRNKCALMALYLPNSTVRTVVGAPCSNFTVLDVPESYEMYPYGFIADKSTVHVINLKECSNSSYTKTVTDMDSYFNAPDALFSYTGDGGYTYTTIEPKGRSHILLKVFNVSATGESTQTTKFTFNPLNGVFQNQTD